MALSGEAPHAAGYAVYSTAVVIDPFLLHLNAVSGPPSQPIEYALDRHLSVDNSDTVRAFRLDSLRRWTAMTWHEACKRTVRNHCWGCREGRKEWLFTHGGY